MKKHIIFFVLSTFNFCYSQGTIKTMFYNLYRFPDNRPQNREYILKEILNEYTPDLFMVCELMSENGADKILNTALQTPQKKFARAKFIPIQSIYKPKKQNRLQQIVFYNTDKLILVNQETLPTSVRDINHYTFKLNTIIVADKLPIYLEIFVTHLKSSLGPANRELRLEMINTFITALKKIPKTHYVLFAGDFNFYNSEKEPGYKKLIDKSNPIIMIDPIDSPGIWHNNILFSKIHTQSTRTSLKDFGLGGSAGGLDDRFDFIMMSENLNTSNDFYYIKNSYKAFGNNGNCLKQRIDHQDCEGVYGLKLRKNLHDMSDHLPVIMELETMQDFKTFPVISKPILEDIPLLRVVSNIVREENLHLKINTSKLLKNTKLLFYNLLGQNIKTVNINKNNSDLKINMAAFSKGIYYMRLDNYPEINIKFIKE